MYTYGPEFESKMTLYVLVVKPPPPHIDLFVYEFSNSVHMYTIQYISKHI